jgi:hypothetical protein
MAADITNGLTAKTLEGAILKATTSDVPASNGVTDVINGVLILPKKWRIAHRGSGEQEAQELRESRAPLHGYATHENRQPPPL